MNQELFLSKELSIKAKEIGFDEPCLSWYWEDLTDLYDTPLWGNHNKQDGCISAPLYQQIIDWLKEKHRILVCLVPYTSGKHKWQIWQWIKISEDNGKWQEYKSGIETKDKALEYVFELLQNLIKS